MGQTTTATSAYGDNQLMMHHGQRDGHHRDGDDLDMLEDECPDGEGEEEGDDSDMMFEVTPLADPHYIYIHPFKIPPY